MNKEEKLTKGLFITSIILLASFLFSLAGRIMVFLDLKDLDFTNYRKDLQIAASNNIPLQIAEIGMIICIFLSIAILLLTLLVKSNENKGKIRKVIIINMVIIVLYTINLFVLG